MRDGVDFVVQVAGVHSQEEARTIIEGGANWIGVPLRLPSGKDDITEADAKQLVAALPDRITSVLITYQTNAAEIDQLVREIGFDAVQIHGDIEVSELEELRRLNNELLILKSLVVGKTDIQELLEVQGSMEHVVDMYLTDTYNSNTGAMGATGLLHNWEDSKAIVQNTQRPVIIAGGLTPENVYEAVLEIAPAGVDAHTGLEETETGFKSLAKVTRFATNARRAAQLLREGNP